MKGVRGVRLETVMMGGRRYTSAEAVERFFARLTAARGEPKPAPSGTRARQIARASERAKATF
jgi:hypothetical protein